MNKIIGEKSVYSTRYLVAALLLSLNVSNRSEAASDIVVKITERVPIQTLDSTGRPSAVSMSNPGATYTLVKIEAHDLVLKDSNGTQYLISTSGTDCSLPTDASQTQVSEKPASLTPSLTSGQVRSSVNLPQVPSEDFVTMSNLNDAFGLALFKDSAFWSNCVSELAARNHFTTVTQSGDESLYLAPIDPDKPQKILDCDAYAMSIEGMADKPVRVAIVFANPVNYTHNYSSTILRKNATSDLQSGVEEVLNKRVQTSANGDVLLIDMPKINTYWLGESFYAEQWQRYLRYMRIPTDPYVLCLLGNHQFGRQGMGIDPYRQAVDDYLQAYHCSIMDDSARVTIDHVSEYIDKGVPLMWAAGLFGKDMSRAEHRTAIRASASDLTEYIAKVGSDDEEVEGEDGKVVSFNTVGLSYLIVGYNRETQEVALANCDDITPILWVTPKMLNRIAPDSLEYLKWKDE